MNAARRARQKARSRSRHDHVKGERCLRCRPLPQEPTDAELAGVTRTWRSPTTPLINMLAGIRGLEAQTSKYGRGPKGIRIRRHRAR